MRFLYENMAAIVVAAVVSIISWIYGGTIASAFMPLVPYLMIFLLEVLIAFPQKRMGETSYDARDRVWRDLKRDPLFWTVVGFFVMLLIPIFNVGLCPGCDYELIAQGHDSGPVIGFLPFCVCVIDHIYVLEWFLIALATMVVTKHSLSRAGKRLALSLIVWNGVLLALLGFVQVAAKAPGPLWLSLPGSGKVSAFFSTFGYPNMAGDYFTTLFGLSVALWRDTYNDVLEELSFSQGAVKRQYRLFWRKNYYLIPAAIFFYAAWNTLSRAAMILTIVLSVLFFLHAFLSFTVRMKKAERFRKGFIALATVGVVAFFASVSIPKDVQREVDSLDADAVLTRVTGKGEYHVRIANELWQDHLLFGCGGWGYKHLCMTKMSEREVKSFQRIGGINVHNDYMQLLAEHGAVGFGALVAMVVLLMIPIGSQWSKLVRAARFERKKNCFAKPIQIFVLPAPAFIILLTLTASLAHAFGDCPFRSPAILTLFFVALAAIPGFLPYTEKEENA